MPIAAPPAPSSRRLCRAFSVLIAVEPARVRRFASARDAGTAGRSSNSSSHSACSASPWAASQLGRCPPLNRRALAAPARHRARLCAAQSLRRTRQYRRRRRFLARLFRAHAARLRHGLARSRRPRRPVVTQANATRDALTAETFSTRTVCACRRRRASPFMESRPFFGDFRRRYRSQSSVSSLRARPARQPRAPRLRRTAADHATTRLARVRHSR